MVGFCNHLTGSSAVSFIVKKMRLCYFNGPGSAFWITRRGVAMERARTFQMGDKKQVSQEAHKQKWWRPDPITGVWAPEDVEGQIDTAETRQERVRTVPTASLEEQAWWSSLEELPHRQV
eukprot:c12084_g1_i1 orf=240-599(-)